MKTKLLKLCIVVFSTMSATICAQDNNVVDKLSDVWEYYGVKPAGSKMDFQKGRPGMFKVFFQNGTFRNYMFGLPKSIITTKGTYELVNDSVFLERLDKTLLPIYSTSPEKSLTFKFISDNELRIKYEVSQGMRVEEVWFRVNYPENFLEQDNSISKEIPQSDLALFSDPMLLKLNRNVSSESIQKISIPQLRILATELKNKSYKVTHRVTEFEAKLSPEALGKQLVIGNGYSRYEQITGIYLSQGQQVVVAEIPEGKEIKILIPNWERRAPEGIDPSKDPDGWGLKRDVYTLKNGVNLIEIKLGGLVYVDYFSETPQKEPKIKLHFVNGKVNGYFDATKHSNKDWNYLIDNAVYPIIDAVGKHIQIAYPVEDCKKYAYGKGVQLIENYDELVKRQYEIMGLEKYNRIPKNRILSRVNYNYYMFRDRDGIAYMGTKPGYAMAMVADPNKVIKGDPCWGFSHEVGHVHQLFPYFSWGGLTEVSNNIYTLYVTKSFGNKSRIMQQDNYSKSRKDIIEKKISYLQDPDVFNRLVPFWQLHLYFTNAGANPDFYPDLFEAFRRQGEEELKSNNGKWGNNPAIYQLNFVKKACEVSKTDLTEFFDKYGFFYVGWLEYEDYGKHRYIMTQEMVDKCKEEIQKMNLPKPKIDISTLTDNNIK
ncbi:M60 family metallopeptidase [Capnocytophaga canimorsus]|uniref:M60 family metallopeptidase n=1 Tax=Capnocytophaga canimorsus TaxID=28188 RepID=UPI0021000215|nr:M60 family metallopeptidase [Capnocytophaga canimorsus]